MTTHGDVPIYHLRGSAAEAGFAHGRLVSDLLDPAFLEHYLSALAEAIRFTRDDLAQQAGRWLSGLPPHFQEEIAALAAGAGAPLADATQLLYADIARATAEPHRPQDASQQILTDPSSEPGAIPGDPGEVAPAGGGPMCSAVVARLDDRSTWIARNCDWLVATLLRGVAGVVHEAPHRIPVLALGIRGDIDVDTGINAEGLWLHLHTLHAADDPPRDRTCISWLFWAREALETCATLDELERFIAATGRDRGVIVVAGQGAGDHAAIFECTRAGHIRHDVDPSRPACATNHPLSRPIDDDRLSRGSPTGTLGRFRSLREGLAQGPPRAGPDDLIFHLAREGVEMRTPRWIRTIYSAVARPSDQSLWFAAGDARGRPAASTGRWTPVVPPWRRRRP